MNNNPLSLAVAISLVAFTLSGCESSSSESVPKTVPSSATTASTTVKIDDLSKVTYSNLSEEKSKNFVKRVLKKYGFDDKKIANYFYYVDYFNSAVNHEGLSKDGFAVFKTISRDGGYPLYLDKLESKNIDFMGTNCRISSFTLMNDTITMDTSTLLTSADNTIIFDSSAIDNFPKAIFSELDKQRFYTFFQGMPTPRTQSIETHVASIEKYWKEHGINIKSQDGLSMIMLINHSDLDDVLFIGHIGVLMQADNGNYLFLEKLSFDLPYQAVIFDNKSQVHAYFMQKYGDMTSADTAPPFLMENMRLFEPK